MSLYNETPMKIAERYNNRKFVDFLIKDRRFDSKKDSNDILDILMIDICNGKDIYDDDYDDD